MGLFNFRKKQDTTPIDRSLPADPFANGQQGSQRGGEDPFNNPPQAPATYQPLPQPAPPQMPQGAVPARSAQPSLAPAPVPPAPEESFPVPEPQPVEQSSSVPVEPVPEPQPVGQSPGVPVEPVPEPQPAPFANESPAESRQGFEDEPLFQQLPENPETPEQSPVAPGEPVFAGPSEPQAPLPSGPEREDIPLEPEPQAPPEAIQQPEEARPFVEQRFAEEPSGGIPASAQAAVEPVQEERVTLKRDGKREIYVEKSEYQEALVRMVEIERLVHKASDHLVRVLDDEGIVAAKVQAWHDLLNDVQESLIAIDMRLFERGDA
ncbi:hypothetical protein JXA12_03860 [Candidatus Woesearchaeota archaeon]|nr:hypothetical protein [Candidatus Woesearchaeota archaeon]